MREGIAQRKFFHYGLWRTTYVNHNKLQKFLHNPEVSRFDAFLRDVVLSDKMPNEYFETGRRVTSLQIEKRVGVITESPSRYKKIIQTALAERRGRGRHYIVLKSLVENPSANIVICEMPVWSKDGDIVGHIDAIEVKNETPHIIIWDYKPRASKTNAYTQVSMYKELFCDLLGISHENVGIGWFDEDVECIARR
jgi:hypothetical protein